MNTNIQIMTPAKMGEMHKPITLTPHQQHLVRVTPFDRLRDALIETGLRDFVIIKEDTINCP